MVTISSIKVGSVSDEFVRFQVSCSCGNCARQDDPQDFVYGDMIDVYEQFVTRHVFARDKTKALLVDGCSGGSEEFVKGVLEHILKLNVEAIWLDWDRRLTDEIISRLGVVINTSAESIKSWDDAVRENTVARVLGDVVERARNIEYQIKHEQAFLENFPFVCKLRSIRWETPHVLRRLMKMDASYETDAHCVLAFDPENGRCMCATKSDEHFFPVKDDIEPEILIQELERGRFPTSIPGLHVSIDSGRWKVDPHPPINYADPNFRYVPMWQRIVRA